MWQDNIIALVTMMFGVFLIPQLYDVVCGGVSLNLITTFGTAFGMLALTVTYITLKFRVSAFTTGFETIIWFLLGIFSKVHLW